MGAVKDLYMDMMEEKMQELIDEGYSEEEAKAELLKQREVRALQALAWNEAIAMCIGGLQSVWTEDGDDRQRRDTFIDNLRAQQRPTNGLT